MAKKKLVLPPKPVLKPRVTAKPPVEVKDPNDIRGLQAVDYTVKLSDGTYLNATGEHADVLFRYLAECERLAAASQMINLAAPSFRRFNADGTLLSPGSTSADHKRPNVRS
jgi:hypothetical protein